MADTKISDLTAGTAAATDRIPVAISPFGSGDNRYLTPTTLATLLGKSTFAAGTLTDSAPMTLTQTWNDAAEAFTALKVNVTNTNSDAASKLIDLQVGGTTMFQVDRSGGLQGANVNGYLKFVDGGGVAFTQNNVTSNSYASAGFGQIGGAHGGFGLASSNVLAWTSSATSAVAAPDLVLARDAAGTLAQRNGTNAQTFRVYRTYTDASNYERLVADGNVFGFEIAGTGSPRTLYFYNRSDENIEFGTNNTSRWLIDNSGHLLAATDNTYDIGASGATRPRTGYFGTSIVSPIATLTQGTITADAPQIDGSVTWNNGAVAFTGWKLNVTATAAAAASALLDIQTAGQTVYKMDQTGYIVGRNTNGTINWEIQNARFTVYDQNNGVFSAHTGLGAIVSGSNGFHFTSAYNTVASGDIDVSLWRDDANILAQRRSTNAQTFRIYNTYTDTSNYERGYVRWSSNVFEVGAEEAGTGSDRVVRLRSSGTAAIELYGNGFARASLDDSNMTMGVNINLVGSASINRASSIQFQERSSDIADPSEGQSAIWQSDGTGAGDDGDIMIKITAGGVTKTATLVDYSAIP